ncbi:hypothetical protein MMC30_001968 [Trapelia coarctata]|nr:hypothetical protein [Trapelia coarctata]
MASVLSSSRRPSAAWSRLKAPQIDALDSYGLPSKGDNFKAQETYYNKIVERYMQFCAAAGRADDALDKAFASLSLDKPGLEFPSQSTVSVSTIASEKTNDVASTKELSTLLFSMRKLREALVASSRTDTFAQRAYVFIIRAAILTSTYESYQPALLHLLYKIHPLTPLPAPELHEFVSYYILDLACRLGDFGEAFAVRKRWRYKDVKVEGIVKALVHDDWWSFWRLRSVVDGYQRKLLGWVEDGIRKHALKCIGRSYLTADRKYVEHCTGRDWDELKEKDGVGWELNGSIVTIRRIKAR